MTINLSNNNPRVNYTATSGQTAFTIPFDYFDDGDISVYQNGTLKTITTHYTISGSTMTLVTGATVGDKIAITRDVPLERTTDLTSTYSASSINSQLDTIVAQIADLDDRVSRSISLNDYEVAVSLDLPATADRLGKTIQFNSSTGALEVGPSGDELTSIASIASDITTVAGVASDLSTVATAASNINAVGLNISKVSTVSSNISTILSVNSNISDIRDVADSITDINDIADSIDQVELVAGSISNVDTVALANSNISTISSNINNINTVSGISSNITTVASITAAISTVNSNAADITTVSNNIDDVNDVANVITKVTSVADNISSVNTLASQASNIGTLAGISGSINSLGGISSDITTLAAVADDIGDAATNAASALAAKTAAESARDATLAAYDSFDDRYLGAKSTEPTLDNDGNPLVSGSLYFDNNSDTMKLYTGSAWVAAYIAGNDYLALSGGTLTGQLNTTSNIVFGDNDKAIFGAGSDLQIYHDGGNSRIYDQGTGALVVRSNQLNIQSPTGEKLAIFNQDNDVELYYDNSLKLATTSTGISVTGNATFADNGKAIFGAGSDLQIYHDGSNSYIRDQGTGDLIIQGGANVIFEKTGGEDMLTMANDGSVVIKYNGVDRIETTTAGVDITGTLASDGLTVDGDAVFSNGDNSILNGDDFAKIQLKSIDGSTNSTGIMSEIADVALANFDGASNNHELVIRTNNGLAATGTLKDRISIANNGDISFYEDTGTTAKFFWDASAEALGLGNTSPSSSLHITSGNNSQLTVEGNDTNPTTIMMDYNSTGSTDRVRIQNDSGDMKFTTSNGQVRQTITKAGNVGIGTSSPAALLHLESASPVIRLKDTDGAAYHQVFASLGNLYIDSDRGNNVATSSIIFRNDATEAMRIDSSGNLLVGKTTTSGTVDGVTTYGSGAVEIVRTSNPLLYLNQQGLNKDIIRFRKDNAEIGAVRAVSGGGQTDIMIGSDATALWFGTGTSLPDSIVPASITGGGTRTDAVNLGYSNSRFKDLYLSGGVVFGTGGPSPITSNTLDDYEEGSFTPTIANLTNLSGTASITRAIYTKVGNLCTIQVRISGLTISSSATDTYFSATLPTAAAMDTASTPAITGVARAASFAATGVVVNYTNGNSTQVSVAFPAENVGSSGAFDITYSLTYRTA